MIPTAKRNKGMSPAHRRSPHQEANLASRTGGQVVKGSGSGPYHKADVCVKGVMLIEAKTTSNKSYGLKLETVRKLTSQAMANGEIPVICIEFLEGDKPSEEVFVIPSWAFSMMFQEGEG